MDHYLIRFIQAHESFRQPEIEALGELSGTRVNTVRYSTDSPFCIVQFVGIHGDIEKAAKAFESRSILSRSIYELWGQGTDYDELHRDIRSRTGHLWDHYKQASFKFSIDAFYNTRTASEQRDIIDSFSYLEFEGKIRMKSPDVEFCVFEEWTSPDDHSGSVVTVNCSSDCEDIDQKVTRTLKHVFLGRKVSDSCRHLIEKHDLKKRPYISTTSMDAELALVTANLALAESGKLFLDPFVGTGGFMVAAAEFGALVLGSDIDGRSFRGKGSGVQKGVGANIRKYHLENRYGDCIISDITNSPFRSSIEKSASSTDFRWLDGIVCDPPYGVREGLKVLGLRKQEPSSANGTFSESDLSNAEAPRSPYLINGIPAFTLPGYVAPKKPYSFDRMLNDILEFASQNLIDRGRLAFWMPSANENENGEEEVTLIPQHHLLELKYECTQRFNRWSRRLLVYQRHSTQSGETFDPESTVGQPDLPEDAGKSADDLNPFRKRYFQAFGNKNRQ